VTWSQVAVCLPPAHIQQSVSWILSNCLFFTNLLLQTDTGCRADRVKYGGSTLPKNKRWLLKFCLVLVKMFHKYISSESNQYNTEVTAATNFIPQFHQGQKCWQRQNICSKVCDTVKGGSVLASGKIVQSSLCLFKNVLLQTTDKGPLPLTDCALYDQLNNLLTRTYFNKITNYCRRKVFKTNLKNKSKYHDVAFIYYCPKMV
jgi:hypothetical protein